jgi:CRP/FNR family transcriptional regulator, cyclic AMP receptor protein
VTIESTQMADRVSGLLRQVPLLAKLDENDVRELALEVKMRRFAVRDVLVEHHEEGNSLFIVASGRLKVVLIGLDGKEVILSHLKAGDFFGEVALLDGGPRSSTVMGLEDGELLELSRESFLKLLGREPRIAARLYRELCGRLRHANSMIGDLALLDVYGRIAHVLIDLSAGATRQNGDSILTPRPKLAEIAGRASTTEETVSRVLRRLHEAGAITLSRRALVVHRPDGLRVI